MSAADDLARAVAQPPGGTPGPEDPSSPSPATRRGSIEDATPAARGDRSDAWRTCGEVVDIACCPVHGLHGERDDCHVCGGPVEHPTFVRANLSRLPIERETRGGGRLTLSDASSTADRCATCGDPDPIGVSYRTTLAGTPTLDTAICATCVSEALAILFGRRHVQQGGQDTDLAGPPDDLALAP